MVYCAQVCLACRAKHEGGIAAHLDGEEHGIRASVLVTVPPRFAYEEVFRHLQETGQRAFHVY